MVEKGDNMIRKLFLLFSLVLYVGCNKSPHTITLKLIPLDIGKSDGKSKSFHHQVKTALNESRLVNISEWKNIKILCNEHEKEIILVNPNIKDSKEIVIPNGESILVSDILKILTFNNEREFFNSLKNTKLLEYPLVIYPYRESAIGSKSEYVYFKHIYGITLSKNYKIKRKARGSNEKSN